LGQLLETQVEIGSSSDLIESLPNQVRAAQSLTQFTALPREKGTLKLG